MAGEGTAELSSYGGWEAEWNIPEKSKLGHFEIRCQIAGEDYDGRASISVEEYRVPVFSVVVEAETEVGQTAHAHVSSAYFHGAPNVGARVHWKATWAALADSGGEAGIISDGITLIRKWVQVSIPPANRPRPSKATRNWMHTDSQTWRASRHSKRIRPSVAPVFPGASRSHPLMVKQSLAARWLLFFRSDAVGHQRDRAAGERWRRQCQHRRRR